MPRAKTIDKLHRDRRKNPNDKCAECGHKRSKHRKRLGICLAHDWFANMWMECHCSGFVQEEKDGK